VGVTKTCDVCRFSRQRIDPITNELRSDVVRYTLRYDKVNRKVNGVVTRVQNSAGGIDLCGDCWQRICAPRTRKRRGGPLMKD